MRFPAVRVGTVHTTPTAQVVTVGCADVSLHTHSTPADVPSQDCTEGEYTDELLQIYSETVPPAWEQHYEESFAEGAFDHARTASQGFGNRGFEILPDLEALM